MFDTAQDPGIDITRDFAAAPEAVFKAWTDPAQFAGWWGGAEVEVPLESVTMDVRSGGKWTATMILQNGHHMPWHGEYIEVDAPRRLVLTLADRPGDEREIVTVTLTPTTSGTQMHVTQHGGHMDADGYAMATEGYQSFFDAMQTIVE